MESRNTNSSIIAWLSRIQDIKGVPYSSRSYPFIPPDTASCSTYFRPDEGGIVPEYFPPINTVHRSTLEILKEIPPEPLMAAIISMLPTHTSSPDKLTNLLPHKVTNPLVSAAVS